MENLVKENLVVALIEQERELSGISYAELGRRLSIDRKRMWRVLNGERRINVGEFIKLCAYFNLSIGNFATRELRERILTYRNRSRII